MGRRLTQTHLQARKLQLHLLDHTLHAWPSVLAQGPALTLVPLLPSALLALSSH